MNWAQQLAMVTEDVRLAPELTQGRLTERDQDEVKRQALERAARISPILKHILEVKVVCNQRRNFINFSIRKDYLAMIHSERIADVFYCFFMSDKLEPFVIITVVHPELGKLGQLTRTQVGNLALAIEAFKRRFGISGESYHYTGLQERMDTESFIGGGGAGRSNKAHSAHFHLKMRVASAMMCKCLPVFALFDFNELRKSMEPVKYNCDRETKKWEEIYSIMLQDALPGM